MKQVHVTYSNDSGKKDKISTTDAAEKKTLKSSSNLVTDEVMMFFE